MIVLTESLTDKMAQQIAAMQEVDELEFHMERPFFTQSETIEGYFNSFVNLYFDSSDRFIGYMIWHYSGRKQFFL